MLLNEKMSLQKEYVNVHDIKDFITGKKEPFPNAGFTLNDNVWDLSYRETRARHKSISKYDFTNFSEWLRPTVKEFVAWSWLFQDKSNSTLDKYLNGMEKFNEYLLINRPDVKSISRLDRTIVNGTEEYIKQEVSSKSSQVFVHSAIKKYAEFLQKNYMELCDKNFYFESGKFSKDESRKRTYKDDEEKSVPLEVCYKIMSAVKIEEDALYKIIKAGSNKNNALNNAKNRLIYCQILKLIIATGRRASHIIMLNRNALRESTVDEAKGVWIEWNETKTKKGYQEVFVPEPLSDIVKEAVDISKKISETLLLQAEEADKKKIFLVYGHPKNGGSKVRVVEHKNIVSFLNGRKDRKGFMEKYNITHNNEIYHLKLHGFRHTRFTQMRLGGAGIGTIQNDAKHISTDMTQVYIDGDEVAKKEFFELVEDETLVGDMAEFIKNKDVRLDNFSPQELERYKKNGMFIQLTHYGYCHLEIEVGPCPSGDPCWIGNSSCGCKYHLMGPKSMEAVEEDVQLYKDDLKAESDRNPNSPLIGHYRAIIARYEELKNQVNYKKKEKKSNE